MKVEFDVLDAFIEALSERLWADVITLTQYNKQWDDLIEFTGWTEEEYLEQLNKGWTDGRKRTSVFLC